MNRMRTLLVGLITLVLAFGACQKDDVQPKSSPVLAVAVGENAVEYHVNVKEAREFAGKIRGALAKTPLPGVRDENFVVHPSHLKKDAEISEIVPVDHKGERVMYVVNYGDEDGYIIFAADKSIGWPLLSVAEKGHLSAQEVATLSPQTPFTGWFEGQKKRIYDHLQKGEEIPKRYQELWEVLGGRAEKGKEISLELVPPDAQGDANTMPRVRGSWEHRFLYQSQGIPASSVVYYCEWGQGDGYNDYAKLPGAYIGCPALAVGILCHTHKYPKDYEYSEMPLNGPSEPLARMLRDIADKIPNYSWGYEGSGASLTNIVIGLKKLGYDARLSDFDPDAAYEEVRQDKPILLYGSEENGAHIWIADGYRKELWKIGYRFLFSFWSIYPWEEYRDCMYMNWGWYGEGNAWVDLKSWTYFDENKMMITY